MTKYHRFNVNASNYLLLEWVTRNEGVGKAELADIFLVTSRKRWPVGSPRQI